MRRQPRLNEPLERKRFAEKSVAAKRRKGRKKRIIEFCDLAKGFCRVFPFPFDLCAFLWPLFGAVLASLIRC
jgi:hypothetical protein